MYVKLVNGGLEYPPINKGNIFNYSLNEELLIEDGYKQLIETEKPGQYYQATYIEEDDKVKQVWVNKEEQYLQDLKEKQLKLITDKAKQAIEDGYIEFKGALFETNTQTINDLDKERQLSIIEGKASSTWLSMDDQIVELIINTENETEDDFVKIGFLVKAYKNNIWVNKYLTYKAQIEEATTVEDVNNINIDYTQDK